MNIFEVRYIMNIFSRRKTNITLFLWCTLNQEFVSIMSCTKENIVGNTLWSLIKPKHYGYYSI